MTAAGSAIIDWAALGKVMLYSLAAGVGISVAFGFAIRGPLRFADLRRDGRPLEAAAYGLLTMVGLAVSLATAGYGIYVMTQK